MIIGALMGSVAGGGGPPSVAWNSIDYTTVNEGQLNRVYLNFTNWDDSLLYWYIVDSNNTSISGGQFSGANAGQFSPGTGNITAHPSFSFTFANDTTTEGPLTYYIRIENEGGTLLVPRQGPFTVADTSLTRVTLTSGEALGFNGTDNRHVIVADNLADWNLGDNWCIEWWQKIPSGASGFLSVLCQDANVPTYSGIDVFINNGNIQMFNGGRQMSEAAAPRDQWNHIAIRNNGGLLGGYINGVSQLFGGSHNGTIAPSSPLNVVIGSRTWDGGTNFYGQKFNGQIANIRISSIARYTSSSGAFTPPTTVEVDQYTKLSLDGSLAGGDGMLTDETARHTITNNGATVDTIS